MFSFILQLLTEIFAVLVAIIISNKYEKWHENKHKLDLNCDNCHRPLKLTRTKDKKYYLCWKCIKLYRLELKSKALEAVPDLASEGVNNV